MRRIVFVAAVIASAVLPAAAGGCSMRETEEAAAIAGPTQLATGTTIVPIRTALPLPASGVRTILVIEGIVFDAPPGVMYEVHLQRSDGKRALVGILNFYNQGIGGYGAAAPSGAEAGRQEFEAGAALRALGGNPTALVFEPTSGVEGAAARVNPLARVRFARVRLERG